MRKPKVPVTFAKTPSNKKVIIRMHRTADGKKGQKD